MSVTQIPQLGHGSKGEKKARKNKKNIFFCFAKNLQMKRFGKVEKWSQRECWRPNYPKFGLAVATRTLGGVKRKTKERMLTLEFKQGYF